MNYTYSYSRIFCVYLAYGMCIAQAQLRTICIVHPASVFSGSAGVQSGLGVLNHSELVGLA